jgi:integrase
MCRRATGWNYGDKRNPVTRVRIGRKQTKSERRILTDEQVFSPLERLPEPAGAIVETAVSTGMRISEIPGLRWRSVNLERGPVRVEERHYRGELAAPKTERSLRLPAPGELPGA